MLKMTVFIPGGQAFANAYFGEGNGSIFLDNVQCSPNNTDILQCHSNPIGSHNCTHSNDAGVRCEGKQHKLTCIYINLSVNLWCTTQVGPRWKLGE